MSRSMSWPLLVALAGALGVLACEPLPVRCRVDNQCLGGMKCDPRQGLCVEEGTYFEHPDGSTAWAREGEDPGGGPSRRDAGQDGGATQTDGGTPPTDAGQLPDGGEPADGGSGCTQSAQCPITAPCCDATSMTCITGVGNCL